MFMFQAGLLPFSLWGLPLKIVWELQLVENAAPTISVGGSSLPTYYPYLKTATLVANCSPDFIRDGYVDF